MSEIRSYRDLHIWQAGMQLAAEVYSLTRSWPREELYGLTSQVRKSAGSVAANIAEGYGRETRAFYITFLRCSQGSLKETETHLLLSEMVGISSKADIARAMEKADELGRMLRRLIRRLGESAS